MVGLGEPSDRPIVAVELRAADGGFINASAREGRPSEGSRLAVVHFPRSHAMSFTLPELPYAYDALAPYMSKETLEYHHDKHHQAYVTNGNNLLKGTEWEGKTLEEIVRGSFGKNPGLFNNAGQHYNHIHFWKWMKPHGGGKIPGDLEKALVQSFGSVEKAKARLDRGRNDAVRFRLGLADRDGWQDRCDQDPERRKPARSQGGPRSSASMSGSIPITSTIATDVPITSRLSSKISSTGNMWRNSITPRPSNISALNPASWPGLSRPFCCPLLERIWSAVAGSHRRKNCDALPTRFPRQRSARRSAFRRPGREMGRQIILRD